jgi:ATP-binding cassette subfamily B (MDR/TAP) protein 1
VSNYVYCTLFTYVAYHLTRNLREDYLRAAFSQEIAYYDRRLSGSIAQQATSNGKLVQSGISEKLGIVIQSISTFVAAFIIAFVRQWKLTLILIWMIPTLLFLLGGVAGIDARYETKILQIYAQAGSYAENILGGIRTIHAFNLQPRMIAKYDTYLANAYSIGKKKNVLYGVMLGGEYFVVFGATGLAFWQGIKMLSNGEIVALGTVFT